MSVQNLCTLQNCPIEIAGLIGKSKTDPSKPVQFWSQSTNRKVVATWAGSLGLPDKGHVEHAMKYEKHTKKERVDLYLHPN